MIGKTLGHYRIVEKIGQGGMGEVFLAEDASLHRKVALKFLPVEMQQDATARRRFVREARSAAALDHPYIWHINEVGQSEDQDFIAMEYVEGQSLKEQLANVRTVNPEAYDAYLKASQYWIKLTKVDLDNAERYFELALQKDPNYAAAYAGIAWVWTGRNQMGISPPSEAVPKMKAAALKAVELDDNLAEAHYVLAAVRTWNDWEMATAEQEWKRAIELNPNYPDGLAMHSHYLMIMRRPDEAMAQIARALELDPFSVIIQSFYAIDLFLARRYEDAIAAARKALQMQPDAPVASVALYVALRELKRYDELLTLDKQIPEPDVKEAFERAYAELGYPKAWQKTADALTTHYGKSRLGFDIADSYMFAGDKEAALQWLQKAYEDRDPNLPYVNCYPIWEPVRSEPRFQALLRRMNLPQKARHWTFEQRLRVIAISFERSES